LTLNNRGPGAFIRRLTQHALEQGWLSMWGLRLNGKVVAMEYQLISGGEVFALRADFDGSLDAISPGSYLSWQLLQELFGSGLTRYWMGPGANAYKGRWTDRGEQLFRAGAYSPTIRGRLHQLNDRVVRPAARTALHVLRASTRAQAGKGEAKK
jgi:CelD/BcsL family acetyltransferase involved in cellulose biosynthesis